MKIPIYFKPELTMTLVENNVRLCDYKPAYGGESAALDLYNTSGEMLSIPPMTATLRSDTLNHIDQSTRQKFEKKQLKTLIPTGIHLALPRNTVALLRERGSITKTPLLLRAGVIDPGYTGEIFVNMVNTSDREYVVPAYAKLPVQLLVVPTFGDFERVITWDKYTELTQTSQRKKGMIGSSDH